MSEKPSGGADVQVEETNFLYPFIDAQEDDPKPLLADLAASAQEKAAESLALRKSTLEANTALLTTVAGELARRFAAGGRMFTFGNGGSSTDATTLATLFARPPIGRPLPARTLTADSSVLTALSNDVGYELVFSRQLIAHARDGDIGVALSTSGSSPNLITALREAHGRGLYTVGFSGYSGGAFADDPNVDACFTVRSQSVHRIQESQANLGFHLWLSVHEQLREQETMAS